MYTKTGYNREVTITNEQVIVYSRIDGNILFDIKPGEVKEVLVYDHDDDQYMKSKVVLHPDDVHMMHVICDDGIEFDDKTDELINANYFNFI